MFFNIIPIYLTAAPSRLFIKIIRELIENQTTQTYLLRIIFEFILIRLPSSGIFLSSLVKAVILHKRVSSYFYLVI